MSLPDRWLLCDPYCAQFKCYHEEEIEMNENEDMPATEAELARALELDAKATQGPLRVGHHGPSRPIIISANMDEPMLSIGALSHGHLEPYEKEDADCELFAEYRTLTPRLARELAAARAAIKVARSFLLRSTHRDGCPKFGIFPKECTCGYDEAFNALNTHTHE